MRKYKTPNGTLVTEDYLINRYGEEKFNAFLSDGKLEEVSDDNNNQEQSSENTYITPNNTEVTESYLIDRYGEEKFNSFLSEGKLKKKGGTDSSSENGSSDSQTTEEDYFTGTFGNVLRGFDEIVPLGIGDFVDDMARSVAQGRAQGIAAENASDLLLRGSNASLEDIQSFIDSQKNAAQYTPSKEMQDYQRIYEENGKGFLGVVLGFAQNPTILAEVALSSMTAMANNSDALLAAGAVVGTGASIGAGIGATAGSVVPVAGNIVGGVTGGISGALSSLPYAFAAAGTALEMGSTFAELLQENAGGRELTKEVIQELLNNEDVYTDIRNKSVARGIAIGAVDAFTGKLGGKIGSKILTKGGDIAVGAATKGRKVASIAAAGGVEAVGGSLGEVSGRLAAGQEMDVSEIALEGIAEAPGSIKDIVSARLAKPTYKVNGEKVPAGAVDNLIETMTLEQLQSTKIDIENDYEGRKGKLQNRIEELSTRRQIQQVSPDINTPTLNEMAKLQLELNQLEGNKTEVAKDKAKLIKEKIKALQENPLQEEVAADVAQAEEDVTPEVVTETNIEEDFAQLTEEEKAPLLERANGNEQEAANLLNEELQKTQEMYPTQRTTQTEVTTETTQPETIQPETVQIETQTTTLEETTPQETAQQEETQTGGISYTLDEPSEEQQLKDVQNGDMVTFIYNNESQIPDVFKGKVSSTGENNGENFVRVTVAKSLADFHLQEKEKETPIYAALEGMDYKTFNSLFQSDAVESFLNKNGFVVNQDSSFILAREYNKAKQEGSNPELVATVDKALSNGRRNVSSKTQEKGPSLVSKIKDFGRNIFGSNRAAAQETTQSQEQTNQEPAEYGNEQGEFVVHGTFNGNRVIAGNKKYKIKYDGKKTGERSFKQTIIDGKKVFSLVLENYHSNDKNKHTIVSLVLPQNTTKTNEEIQYILNRKAEEVDNNLELVKNKYTGKFRKPVDINYKDEAMTPSNGVEEGEFAVQGTFQGEQVILGNEKYADENDNRMQMQTQEDDGKFLVKLQGNKKIFRWLTIGRDEAGRPGYMGVSLALPRDTKKTDEEVIEILKAKTAEIQSKLDPSRNGKLKRGESVDVTYRDEQGGRFRLGEEGEADVLIKSDDTDVLGIIDEMNAMPAEEIDFVAPQGETVEVNPLEESVSTEDFSDEDVKALGFNSREEMVQPLQNFADIPMVKGVSDIAAGGTILDSKGKPMKVKGGIMFNALAKIKAAWAGVEKAKSETQYKNALQVYNNNKDLFERLWTEKKIPYGHVPMAIIRMSDNAIDSNEIVFRYLAPEVKSQSKENQTAALNDIITVLKKNKGEANKRLLKFINDKGITTLGQLFDGVVKDANVRAKSVKEVDIKKTLTLDERAELFSILTSSPDVQNPNKPFLKSLYNGAKKNNSSLFISSNIYKAVGEPSMMKTKKGDIVSIVGIDVLNGGVTNIDHQNYGTGPKGRLIALISNPTNGINVFPTWRAKASRIFKEDKAGKRPNQQTVAGQTMGTAPSDLAFQGDRMTFEMTDLDILLGKLRFAFPKVTVVRTQQEFDNILKQPGIRTKITDGKVILGMTKDGKIYLNPDSKSMATPIHEYGHIWIDFLRSKASGENGTALLNRGLKLVEGTKELKEAIAKYGDNPLAREEALVELMATKGSNIVDAAQQSKFLEWMNAVFKYIKGKFISSEKLFAKEQIKELKKERTDEKITQKQYDEKLAQIKKIVNSNIENMSLEDFINTGLADLFGGKQISESFNAEKESAGLGPRYELGDNVVKFIKDARAQGISEAAIKITLRRNGVSNEDIVSGLEKSKAEASVRTELSETFVEGYDRMMNEVDGIIKKSKKRGRTDAEILNNITEYIMGSKAYENATDVQRDKLIRDARKMMGVREKSAPSAGRLIGIIKDIKNITMSEKELLYKRLKDFEEGAKTAKQAWVNASKQLAEEVSELEKKGKINASQMAAVISKFSKVNMFNPASVERFVDYMSKVFNDADYANKIENANTKRKAALANVETKIGISDILAPKLQQLFSINPSLIPMSVLNKYISLVDTFSQRKTVLSLPPLADMIALADNVLDAVDEEQSQIFVLADRLNASENKVFNEDGSLNYADTLKEMLKNEEINESELEIMKKYKSQILPKKVTEAMSDAEIEAKKTELINQINNSDAMQISSLPSRDERNLAGRIERLLMSTPLKSLSINELENILKVLDNINNGYLPHYAQLVVEQLNNINNTEKLSGAIDVAKPLPFTSIYARLKSIVTKKGSIQEMVRRNPLFYIDQVFGNFKTKDIFNSIFGMASEEVSKFRSSLKNIQDRITKAEQAVINSFGKDHNKFVMSKYKQMAYMIQEEFLSNPDSKQVNSVSDFLKATIKRIDEETTSFTERDADMLQDILDKYTDSNGNFDNQALYNSFNSAEKKSIKTLQDINLELGPKAVYTASIIRGDKIKPLQNYVHLNVINEAGNMDEISTASFAENFNNSLRPSTKAKSLIERTGKVSALNFDVYSSVQKGAKFVLMDYHLTEPIRTARRTINQTEKNLTKNGRMSSDKRKVFNAIKNAFEESTSNLLDNSFTETSVGDDAFNYIKKQGYRAILASGSRFIAELTSNVSFALIVDPKGFIAGTKLRGFITSPEALQAMNNLNSVQTNRVFPNDSLSGRIVDTNGFNETKGTKGGKARGTVRNYISKMWNKTGQRWVNGVEVAADALISTPDKLVMRPMWFGAFENRFKELTGKSPDFAKISANDEAYMNANRDALKQATELADNRSVMAGATDNAFMGMLKGTAKPNQSISKQAFNAFNNFMTRFLIFEYITARSGIMAMVNRGEMSRRQGAAVIGGVMSRMVLYTLIGQILAETMTGMFDGDDEEDKDSDAQNDEPKNKSFEKKLGQAFASSFTSLLFGRDFGNATKSIINLGVEDFNQQQLGFLRDGDYDPYKDAIQYTVAPTEKQGKQTGLGDILMKLGAAYGPALKTADLIVRKTLEPKRKEADAIKRQEDERFVRIPLEILGNLGFVPMYKDIRKAVLTNMYKDLAKAERTAGDKKKAEEEMLQGYDNQTDMKRYDRELWERTYGPNSPNYDAMEAEREIDRQKRKIRQQLKDEMYDYTPKTKRSKAGREYGGIGGGAGIGGRGIGGGGGIGGRR